MSLLITGGNGYIGSQLVNHLINDDINEIIIFDQIESKKDLTSQDEFKEKVKFVKGSIVDDQQIYQALKNVDQVIHLAAIADTKKCQQSPIETRKINVEGTRCLLKAIEHNNNVKRIVFASTISAIYGKSTKFDESISPSPIIEYGKQKLEAEKLIQEFTKKSSIESIILRKSNLYGAGIITKENVVAVFVKQALQKGQISIEGSGKQFRNFLNLNDACTAYIKSLKCKMKNPSEIINIIGPNTINLIELAEIVKKEVEAKATKEVDIIHSDSKGADDYGEIEQPKISIEKSREILGYMPQISLKKGISELINFYDISGIR